MTALEQANKATIRAAFDDWAAGTGGPLDLLAPHATWTIVGNSPISRMFESRQEFLEGVIEPFYARLATPLVPAVRALYGDGDTVIVFFDTRAVAKDGRPYENTLSWFLRMQDGAIVEGTAFFDTIELTDLWSRITP